MARLFIVLSLLSFSTIALADESTPPKPAFSETAHVDLHGLPGDVGYYEIHTDYATGMVYFVGANGEAFQTLGKLLLARMEVR
jgi:hypothetical protein